VQIKYICPFWGWQGISADDFIDRVIDSGYDGIEIDMSSTAEFEKKFLNAIETVRRKKNFIFIAQQWLPPAGESFEEYKQRFSKRLDHLIILQPVFINSHTGKDFFSFDENCRLIETAMNISAKTGIRILHETHRGRFTFHAYGLLPYLEKFPELELVADFSHWCTVSESLLEDQEAIIERIIPRTGHIHARIGYEHSPQVNDFRAPEWKQHVNRFVHWWQKILDQQNKKGKKEMTICPEFGPIPYMPTAPFIQQPLADQWEENIAMMEMLKGVL